MQTIKRKSYLEIVHCIVNLECYHLQVMHRTSQCMLKGGPLFDGLCISHSTTYLAISNFQLRRKQTMRKGDLLGDVLKIGRL